MMNRSTTSPLLRLPRLARWLLGVAVVLLTAMVAALLGVQHWVGTEDFRQRLGQEASHALGVEVKFGRTGLDWWPVPALAVDDLQVLTRPPLSAGRIELRPRWSSLLVGRPALSAAVVRHAVVAQVGLDALLRELQKKKQTIQIPQGESANSASGGAVAGMLAGSRIVLDDVAWQGSRNELVALDADIRLGEGAWPDAATVKVLKFQFKGVGDLRGSVLDLARDGAGYKLALQLHGGSGQSASDTPRRGVVRGRVDLAGPTGAGAATQLSLKGSLVTNDLDVALFGEPKAPLSGRLEAQTTLSARAANAGGLLDALQTDSKFTVRNAVVHGIDLAKAVKTVGLNRGGETKLDTLAGQVRTQGKALQLSNLVASSGVLTASGDVAVSPARALSGRINVALGDAALPVAAKGAVGVPLVVGGTLDSPEVTLTRSAMIGAAIGTAVLPGVGTGAGASLGDRVGEKLKGLFGR